MMIQKTQKHVLEPVRVGSTLLEESRLSDGMQFYWLKRIAREGLKRDFNQPPASKLRRKDGERRFGDCDLDVEDNISSFPFL